MVTLTHPSVADWTTPQADPSASSSEPCNAQETDRGPPPGRRQLGPRGQQGAQERRSQPQIPQAPDSRRKGLPDKLSWKLDLRQRRPVALEAAVGGGAGANVNATS